MSRPLRIEFAGGLYHVTSRGDGRDAIFLGKEDRRLFLRRKSESDPDFLQCCMWKEVVLICASWRPIIEPTMHNSHASREGLWAKLKT